MKISGVEKLNVGNRLKRVLAKFDVRAGYSEGVARYARSTESVRC